MLAFFQSYLDSRGVRSPHARSLVAVPPMTPAARLSTQTPTTPSPSPLMSLPPEIVLYIAHFVPKRQHAASPSSVPSRAAVTVPDLAHSDLTSLASTCHAFRTLLLPVLFANLTIHSSSRLIAISKAPVRILSLVRSLQVQLDLDFYETWIWSLDHRHSTPTSAPSPHASSKLKAATTPQTPNQLSAARPQRSRRSTSDPLYAFASILVKTAPSLRTFAFVMQSRPTSSGNAWSQFPRPGMAGIPFASAVVPAMREALSLAGGRAALEFPELRTLHLDASADVEPLLALAPGLRSLRLRIPEGFNAPDCRRIIESLHHVPKLRKLEMWVWELVAPPMANAKVQAAELPVVDVQKERSKLLTTIGRSCPALESVSFQTRSFDYADGGMVLRVLGERGFDWRDMIPVLPDFPKLTELYLPGTLLADNEKPTFFLAKRWRTFRNPAPTVELASSTALLAPLRNLLWPPPSSSPASYSSTPHPPSPPPFPTVLEKLQDRERQTSASLMQSAPNLRKVGWVREAGASVTFERCEDDEDQVDARLLPPAPEPREYRGYLFDEQYWDDVWRDEQDDFFRRHRNDTMTSTSRTNANNAKVVYCITSFLNIRFSSSRRPSQFRRSSSASTSFDPHFIARSIRSISIGFDCRTLSFLAVEFLLNLMFFGGMGLLAWLVLAEGSIFIRG